MAGDAQSNAPLGQPMEQASARVIPPGGLEGDQASPGMRAGLHQGDELPPNAPGAGENVCRGCGGSGQLDGGQCEMCGGTGKIIESVAGGP